MNFFIHASDIKIDVRNAGGRRLPVRGRITTRA
jgi:hypothetical protein